MPPPVIEERFGEGIPDRTFLVLPLTSNKNLGTSLGTNDEADDDSAKKVLLLKYCDEPRSKREIQEYLGITSERYVRQMLIYPLLESGALVRTIPDKPKSPKQKYVRRCDRIWCASSVQSV